MTVWFPVENQNAAEVPPFGLMRLVGMDDDGTILVDQPNTDGQTDVLVNGPWPIPSGERGQGHCESPCQVYYDTGNSPAAGETWGAAAGSWKLTKDKAGAKTLDEGDHERVNVIHGFPRPASAATSSPLTTKGDLYTYSTVDARLAVGSDGDLLESRASETTGLKWVSPTGTGAPVRATSPTITTPSIGTSITVPNTGLLVLDTDASHTLALVPGSNLSANRQLSLITGDSNRAVTIPADTTIPIASQPLTFTGPTAARTYTLPDTDSTLAAATGTSNLSVSNTAPSIALTDTTAAAKSLTVSVDSDLANLRESAGAAGSLLLLDLANNRLGLGSSAPATQFHQALTDATTNTATTLETYDHNSSGTPAAGFGSSRLQRLASSTTSNQDASAETTTWATATHASRKARRTHSVYDASAAREYLRGEASGSAPMIGFLGASAVIAQTGDAGTALVTFGLMSGTPTFAAANLSGTVSTAQIADDQVTYAKLQNVSATGKILGRSTAGAGDVEEIACTAAGRALLDDADAAAQRTTLGLGTVATLASDTDGTLAANSDANVATQKAVKTYADAASAIGSSGTTLSGIPRWIASTKTYTDFAIAATSNDLEIFSLPAGAVVHACAVIHTVAFTGGALAAYTITIGKTGNQSLWASSRNIFSAVTDTASATVSTTQAMLMPDYDTVTSIRAYVGSVAANLNAATAGSVRIMLLLSQPKA